jgi:DsbC/DsbD-like thiol-disulfide interchange protein
MMGRFNFSQKLTGLLALASGLMLGAKEVPLEIQLISEVKTVAVGQAFYVGLSLHHGRGYHTYWEHPGCVGVATSIQWQLPAGVKVSPIEWPEPEHVKMFTYDCQGFERDVVLPMKVTVSQAMKELTLKGEATWMCCNKECNPGFQPLSLTLPIGDVAEPDAENAAKIRAELARKPQESAAWHVTAQPLADGKLLLSVKPQAGARLLTRREAKALRFHTLDGFIDSKAPQEISIAEDGSVTLSLVPAEYVPGGRPKTLRGVIMRDESWQTEAGAKGLKFSVPLPAQ